MGRERELLERAVDEAFSREASSQVPPEEARRTVVSRGRRRRLMQTTGGSGLVVAIVLAATMMFEPVTSDDSQFVSDSRAIGAEKIMDFGGPMAASDRAIYVANGYMSNDAGDKGSIGRLDLDTFKESNTEPIAMAETQNVALATAGLWQVGWSGDIGGSAHGRIQLADPDTGEVLLDLPRDNSAPYDVAVAERGGRELAWVIDTNTEQLLAIDPTSGLVEAIDLDFRPTSVTAGDGAVWVTGSAGRGASTLVRYIIGDGSLESYPVDHCLGNLLVVNKTIWGSNGCDGTIHSFDSSSGEELTTVQIVDAGSDNFGGAGAMTSAKGWLWVISNSSVQRVDPATSELVGDPIWVEENIDVFDGDILAVRDDVFVSSMAAGVYRLAEGLPVQEPPPVVEEAPEAQEDPRGSDTCALENVMCIPLDREWSIAGAGFRSGWVGNVGEGKTFGIVRFDAETGEEVGRLPTDGFVVGFAADDRWMWALVEAGDELSALKIDPSTTMVEDKLDLGTSGNVGEPSIVAGSGLVFVSLAGGSVTRIWSADGKMETWSYADELPGYGASNGPLHLAYGDNHLWLSYGQGHLAMVDPASGTFQRLDEDALGVNAYEIAYAGDQLWAPHQTPSGKNIVSYVSITGEDRGEVELERLPGHVASDGQRLWALQDSFEEKEPGAVVEIDPRDKLVVELIEVDLGFQGGIAAGDGYVWVTGNKVLYRIAVE